MGIAGSDDHVYVWFRDGTVGSGTNVAGQPPTPRFDINPPPGGNTRGRVYMKEVPKGGPFREIDLYYTPSNKMVFENDFARPRAQM